MTGILWTSAPAGVSGPGSLAVRPAPGAVRPAVAAGPTALTPAAAYPGTGLPTGRRPRLGTAVAGRLGTRGTGTAPLPVHRQRFQNDATTLGIHSPGRPLS